VSKATVYERLAAKTPEASFLHILQTEFNFPLRTAREVLAAAQEVLVGQHAGALRPGQMRLVVARTEAPFGPSLADTDKIEVTLTVDSGTEDAQVKAQQGAEAQRRGRLLRLTTEALEQGGVLTQEDLARVLSVDRRTIERDLKVLRTADHSVPTRGVVKNVGRGQSHKVRIIELWLDREGYDKIARWVHHSPTAIQRYVSTFLRMGLLHEAGMTAEEIAFLTQTSVRLVRDYLRVYQAAQAQPGRREKLTEELARVQTRQKSPEKGAEKGGKRR
jgi:predicted transcriptional regulator